MKFFPVVCGRPTRRLWSQHGAHLCSPFQCELCWFRNLEGRDPVPGVHDLAIALIRHSNLDNIAGRAPSTIRSHILETRSIVENLGRFGLTVPLHTLSPMPLGDPVGMGIAVAMQLKFLTAKGRIVSNPQYATVRGVRGTATLNWQSSPVSVGEICHLPKARVGFAQHPACCNWIGFTISHLEWNCRWGCRHSRIRQ